MAKILVALDGSAASERALQAAVNLSRQDGADATVTAVGVLHNSGDPHLKHLAQTQKAEARRRLESILAAAANFARSRGVRLTPLLREGHPAEVIVACAEEQQAKILVLGSRANATSPAGLGGTADQVSSHAPCTVMIVR